MISLLLSFALVLLGCGGMKTTKAETEGHQLYEQGEYDQAIAKYEEVLAMDPGKKEMYSYIARAQQDEFSKYVGTPEAEGKADGAIQRWEKVKELFPEDATEYKEAESQINDILDKTGKRETGTAYYRSLVDKTPNPGNYMLLAKSLFEGELKFSDGVDALDEGIAKFPDDKWLHLTKAIYLWGWVYKEKTLPVDLKRELVDKGMAAVQRSIEIDPELATPYSYRNLLYRQYAELEPEKADEYMNLAKLDVLTFKDLWPKEKEWRDAEANKAALAAAPPPQ